MAAWTVRRLWVCASCHHTNHAGALVCELCERLSPSACAELPRGLLNAFCVGTVLNEVKGGYLLNIGGKVRAFLPRRKSGLLWGSFPFAPGDEVEVAIESVDSCRGEVLLTRLPVIMRLAQLSLGQVVIGRVEAIAEFGVFLRVGGILGLIHKSELARGMLDPNSAYAIDQEVEVEVIDIDFARGRIAFSRRKLLPMPWEYAKREWPPGSLVTGEVASIVSYGVFIRLPLPPELGIFQGLVHLTEMTKRYQQDPGDVVSLGETLKVRVISYHEDRVKLSMRAAK